MAENKSPVRVLQVYVNRMPYSCNECPLLRNDGCNECAAIDSKKNYITGDPESMEYRRSDCPLIVGGGY